MNDPALRLAEAQHGLVSLAQVRAVGASPEAIRHLFGSHQWVPITDEVVRRRGTPLGRGQRVMAAVLDSGPGAVLSHRSAASWWGVRGAPLEPLHVTRTSRSRRRSGLAELHVVRDLPPAWTTVLDGVPIARPPLVALHLFATSRYEQAERWVETMWSLRLLDGASLHRLLRDLGRRGRNGTAGVRRYLADRGGSYVPAASGLEARVLQILRHAGIDMRRQVDTGDDVHWTGRVDFRHVALPVILEVQSERHHEALVDRRSDDVRRARLMAAGFIVAEVTDAEVWQRPSAVVERVNAAIRACERP